MHSSSAGLACTIQYKCISLVTLIAILTLDMQALFAWQCHKSMAAAAAAGSDVVHHVQLVRLRDTLSCWHKQHTADDLQ